VNEQNYASREASERLVKAGIVLETDSWWRYYGGIIPPDLIENKDFFVTDGYCPAPSMAEVWRELPEWTTIRKIAGTSVCWIEDTPKFGPDPFAKINPTDALIDLLIWARKEKP
jgi:hypothetical protein